MCLEVRAGIHPFLLQVLRIKGPVLFVLRAEKTGASWVASVQQTMALGQAQEVRTEDKAKLTNQVHQNLSLDDSLSHYGAITDYVADNPKLTKRQRKKLMKCLIS
ncbi:hypothetical protein NDU88_009548 [Pleurodeles waltl]|uniref:Uncharacterized protein n=1 Tax=Pleurodeles waltl TaxID=8319 RepID=A0AAV7PW90_PLEWA|nr:hypothetical protein NDU88_009548 [Pleurodeles waltl]